MLIRLLFALLLLMPGLARAAGDAELASPDGRLKVTVGVDGDGRPQWTLTRDGKPVIAPSRLGFILADQPKLDRHFALGAQTRASVDTRWEQPWGERRYVRDHHNELRVRLTETVAPGRSLDVVFRLFDTGVGFRYEFPDQPGLKAVRIQEELTQFNLAETGTAWWPEAFEWNREEYLYNRTPLTEIGVSQTPMTVRLASGLHLSFHEAALVDYPAMNIAHVSGTAFKAALTPAAYGPQGGAAGAVPDAVADDPDRRNRARPVQCQRPDAQPQRAEQAR